MSEYMQVKRVLEDFLPKSTTRRLVLLTGARQTGKTTLSKSSYPDLRYINLDAPENREAARAMPTSSWGRDVGNAVIDEVELSLVITASGGVELLGKLSVGAQAGIKVKLKRSQ